MKTKNVYSAENNQLDIVDEAVNLMAAAANEVRELTFAEALEIVKIERLDMIRKELNRIEGRINVVANTIHEMN